MNISFIIPAYNEEKYIGECLASIIKYAPADAEIIAVDNNSADRTAEIIKQFPRVILLKEEKPGTNNARQRGLEKAQGELVAFIDADCRLSPLWMEKAQSKFNNNPQTVALSGPYHFPEIKSKFRQWLISIFDSCVALVSRLGGYGIYGGNLLARRSALLQANGLNTKLTFYGDDTDTGKRLKKIGKIKFAVDFYVYSSIRRFRQEGLVRSALKYIISFFSVVFFKKTLLKNHNNIR